MVSNNDRKNYISFLHLDYNRQYTFSSAANEKFYTPRTIVCLKMCIDNETITYMIIFYVFKHCVITVQSVFQLFY